MPEKFIVLVLMLSFRRARQTRAAMMCGMPTDYTQELAALKDALGAARAYL
jgi:hypothetical protein